MQEAFHAYKKCFKEISPNYAYSIRTCVRRLRWRQSKKRSNKARFPFHSGQSLREYKRGGREEEAAERLIICAIAPKTDDNQISAGSVARE